MLVQLVNIVIYRRFACWSNPGEGGGALTANNSFSRFRERRSPHFSLDEYEGVRREGCLPSIVPASFDSNK